MESHRHHHNNYIIYLYVYTEKGEFNWIMLNIEKISTWQSYYIICVIIYVLNMIYICIYIY